MLNTVKSFVNENRFETVLFLLFSIPAVLYVDSIGPIVCHDTIAYNKMRINLLPIYPILYRGLGYIFEPETRNMLMMSLYLLLTLPTIHWFVWQLKKHFQINKLTIVTALIAMYVPIYAKEHMYIMNNLGTEGFSFALYLIILMNFYKGFVLRNKKNRWYTLFFIATICLLRGQFKFLFPLLLVYEIAFQVKTKKFKWQILSLLIAVPLLTNLVDATYHKVLHGKFVTSPFTFITLNSIPMFVSDYEDVHLFEDEYTKDFFMYLHHRLSYKNMLYSKYKNQSLDSIYQVYYNNMPVICNQTIHTEGNLFLWQVKNEDGDWSWVYNERLNKKMMPILVKDNFDKWFRLCWRNFIECFRGWIGMLLVIGLFIYISFQLLFKKLNNEKLFIWFLLAIIITNAVVVAIAIHAIERFFFYNYWVVFFVIFMLYKQFKNKWNYQS